MASSTHYEANMTSDSTNKLTSIHQTQQWQSLWTCPIDTNFPPKERYEFTIINIVPGTIENIALTCEIRARDHDAEARDPQTHPGTIEKSDSIDDVFTCRFTVSGEEHEYSSLHLALDADKADERDAMFIQWYRVGKAGEMEEARGRSDFR